MKTRKILHQVFPAGMVLVVIFILGGCAPKKNIWGDTQKGLLLSYRMTEGETLTYRVTGNANQTLEINQQKLLVTLTSFQMYTFVSQGNTLPLSLRVTIDTMYLHLKTPMAEMDPDMQKVIGKSLTMNLSALGSESGYEEASGITFSIGPESRNLGSEFQAFFPNFPGYQVKPGDSWTYPDTVEERSGANWLAIYASNTATLEGYETLGNRECARIVVAVTGAIAGKGHTQGVETESAGEFSGTDRVWFDYKNGVLVKVFSEGKGRTDTRTSGIQQMIIPSTREMTREIVLEE